MHDLDEPFGDAPSAEKLDRVWRAEETAGWNGRAGRRGFGFIASIRNSSPAQFAARASRAADGVAPSIR